MAFQFPINPTVGQIFNPVAGASYKWNGTGWTPWSSTFLGGLTFTGPVLFADGTAANPGISWANEPSSGWWRPVANNIFCSISGTSVFELNANDPAITGMGVFPRSASGIANLGLVNTLSGSSSGNQLNIQAGPAGYAINGFSFGGAAALPLNIGFILTQFASGPTRHFDGLVAAPGISWVGDGGSGFYRDSAAMRVGMGGVNITSWNSSAFFVQPGITFQCQGPAFFTNDLTASGNTNLGSTGITGNLYVNGTLGSAGTLTVNTGGISVTGNSSITGTLTTADRITVNGGGIIVTGNSYINGTLGVAGLVSLQNGLNVTGAVVINGPLNSANITGTIVGIDSDTRWFQDASFVYFQMAPSWYWQYTLATGRLAWSHGGVVVTTLDANGDFYAGNSVFAGQGNNIALISASNPRLRWTTDGWRLEFDSANGNLNYISAGNTTLVQMSGAGRLSVAGDILTGGPISAGVGSIVASNGQFLNTWNNFDARGNNFVNASILVSASTGQPGISLLKSGIIAWTWSILNIDMFLSSNAMDGPSGLAGYSMQITPPGNCYARSFNPVTFAATNIVPLTGALIDVLKLRGVRCINTETGLPDIMVEVNDVELVFPELVSTTDGGRGINYALLVAPMIEAIRNLNDRLTAGGL